MSTAAGARDQVARLLTLVPYVHRHGGVRLGEAADLLGVTPEQLVRDLKVLFLCGLPGGLPDDLIDVDLDAIESVEGSPVRDGLIRVENADYLARPLRLTATEASALLVALRALREGSSEATATVVDSVLAKLERALTVAGPPPVDVAPTPVDEVRAAAARLALRLDGAARERRTLRLRYFTPSRQEESERVVEPYGVVRSNGFGYLDAWCRTAGAERLFRLDRIRGVEDVTSLEGAPTGPLRPARDLAGGLFEDVGADAVVTLHLAPEARWAADYYPVRDVRPRADGSADVDLVVVDAAWLHRLVLRLAPHARVLAPQEFIESSTAAAQAALRLYEGPGVG